MSDTKTPRVETALRGMHELMDISVRTRTVTKLARELETELTAALSRADEAERDAERWRKLMTLITGYSGIHYTIKIAAANYHRMDFAEAFKDAVDAARKPSAAGE